MSPQEIVMLVDELEIKQEITEWLRFDLVFGLIVMLNSLFVGIEIHFNKPQDPCEAEDGTFKWDVWFYCEIGFLACFTYEWFARVCYAKTWRKVLFDTWTW